MVSSIKFNYINVWGFRRAGCLKIGSLVDKNNLILDIQAGLPKGHPLKATSALTKCEKMKMPTLPNPFWLENNSVSLDEWLETDPDIIKLRKFGVWTDLCDRIASFSTYFYNTEHSAQISGPRFY